MWSVSFPSAIASFTMAIEKLALAWPGAKARVPVAPVASMPTVAVLVDTDHVTDAVFTPAAS